MANGDGAQWTAIYFAAVVKELISAGAHINAQTNSGGTPLQWAASEGPVAIAELLLQNGAQLEMVNNSGDTALHCACGHGHLPVVKLMLDNYNGRGFLAWRGFKRIKDIARKDAGPTALASTIGDLSFKARGWLLWEDDDSDEEPLQETFEASLGKYLVNLKEPLGLGAFSTVYRAHHVSNRDIVALKTITWNMRFSKMSFDPVKDIVTYTAIPPHRNIMSLLDHGAWKNTLYLVMELYELGNLEHCFLRLCPSPGARLDLMDQAARGLLHLHSQTPVIVHRGVKPQNMLLRQEGSTLVLKLADVGLAKVKKGSNPHMICNSLLNEAPDVLVDTGISDY